MQIILVTKMDAFVYVHHEGQAWHPDSTSKINLRIKEKNYIEIFYDLIYSLPITNHGNKKSCQQYNEYSFDYCFANVRIPYNRPAKFKVHSRPK